jgi:hypothetical protein
MAGMFVPDPPERRTLCGAAKDGALFLMADFASYIIPSLMESLFGPTHKFEPELLVHSATSKLCLIISSNIQCPISPP